MLFHAFQLLLTSIFAAKFAASAGPHTTVEERN
jgi:hypothetical protein